MSMISAQIDELRDAANRGGLVVGLPEMLREAADTIWELRDDLQRANAAVQDAEHDESMAWDRVRKAESENAKLRRLVADMWFWHYEGHIDSESQERQMLHIDAVIQRMRELGIEVDE